MISMCARLKVCSDSDFGLRRQPAEAKRSEDWSAAATALSPARKSLEFINASVRSKSGVALPPPLRCGAASRFPPQSKTRRVDEHFLARRPAAVSQFQGVESCT
jgi:hypothetical protein